MAKFEFLDIRGTKKVPSAFGNVFICSGAIGDAKTVTFPNGYLNGATPEPNLAFKVVFPNGHNAANASSYLSLNGVVVVSNQNGTLAPLPIHEITSGIYSVLQANAVLELYYTENYDGNSHPAFVIVGNPVVLSSSNYTIYADGKIGDGDIGDIKGGLYSTAPYGWILCNGTAYNKADYPKLWDILPSTVKNTSNNTFTIDLRESTLKGIGLTSNPLATNHYNSDGLALGEFINDRYMSHSHPMPHTHNMQHTHSYQGWGAGGLVSSFGQSGPQGLTTGDSSETNTGNPSNSNTSASGSGTTTEVKSVGVNFIIKAM